MRRIIHRLFGLFLAACMIVALFPSQSYAIGELSGQCGDTAYWEFDEATGTLTIKGSGRMYDYAEDPPPWCFSTMSGALNIYDQIKNVVIEHGITYIGQWAFGRAYVDSRLNLQSISISNAVQEIGIGAFSNTGMPSEIYIPASVMKIGENSFASFGLQKINVDERNQFYMSVDGMLCSKGPDSELLWARDDEIIVPASVKKLDLEKIGCRKIHIPASVETLLNYFMAPYDCEIFFYGPAPEEYTFAWAWDIAFEPFTMYYPESEPGWDAFIADYHDVWEREDEYELINFIPWNPEQFSSDPGQSDNNVPSTSSSEESKLCEKHKYTSAGGDYCTVCGYKFVPVLSQIENEWVFVKQDNVPIRDSYYALASNVVRREKEGNPLLVVATLNNALGNLWYKLNDGTYVYSENITLEKPEKYIVYFDANGGINAPGVTSGYTKRKVPTNTVPTRDGYTFIGYSTDKKATVAQFVPGQYIEGPKQMTLYAVWEKNNDYDTYRKKIDSLKAAIGSYDICQRQINMPVKNSDGTYTRDPSGGRCNISSVVTLLNRNLYYDGKEQEGLFTPYDAFRANGCESIVGPILDMKNNFSGNSRQEGYYYKNGTSSWMKVKYTNSSGTSYQLCGMWLKTINNNRGTQSVEEYIASILMQHPEGICLRNTKANHIVVLTDFEIDKSTGSFKFFVQDPVRQYTGPYEGSYISEKDGGDLFTYLDFIAYIK